MLEREPSYAAAVFGEHGDAVRQFTANLAEHGETLGLIGPLELPRLWTRHIINCGLVAPLLPAGRVADVGSGAGLPGLVLAIMRPDAHLILIEPMERRVAWLTDQARELGLSNVQVIRERAESAGINGTCHAVTARAVSALKTLIPLTAPLLMSGGELILMKGQNAQAEIDAASKQIAKYKLRDVRVEELGAVYGADITRVIRARVD